MKKEVIEQVIREILEHLRLADLQITVEEQSDGSFYVNLTTPEAGLLIGHRGENIASLQFLVKNILFNELKEHVSCLIDIEGYRQEQEKNALKIAKSAIEEVLATGLPVRLPPMNAYFRKRIHLFVAEGEFKDQVMSESTGDSERRSVVIQLKTA